MINKILPSTSGNMLWTRNVSLAQAKKSHWSSRAKAGWREIAGKKYYFRSKWENNYARYLELLKINGQIVDWQYEPKTFYFEGIRRGAVSYKPDFAVVHQDKSIEWVEVKGYLSPRDKTKLKRFKEQFPEEEIKVIEKTWFAANNPKLQGFINGWE